MKKLLLYALILCGIHSKNNAGTLYCYCGDNSMKTQDNIAVGQDEAVARCGFICANRNGEVRAEVR